MNKHMGKKTEHEIGAASIQGLKVNFQYGHWFLIIFVL